MCLNTDNTLSMVDRENATQFYLNQHVYIADMKVNYELIPYLKASYDESYKAYSEISKGKVCLLISNSQDHQDCSKYKLIFTEHLNKHATLESITMYVKVDDNCWALDNYGDGRVVWWNMDKNIENGEPIAKPNQKFKLIFT